jgi:hypothetical protein
MIVVILTAFTLVAFAANSLICRMALGEHLIDPVSFTTFRLVTGAPALIPIFRQLIGKNTRSSKPVISSREYDIHKYTLNLYILNNQQCSVSKNTKYGFS